MSSDLVPIVGNWYRHLDKGPIFSVIAIDESDATIELQHFDGDIEEISQSIWCAMDLELSEAPEDCTGPMDVVEQDDLGYSSDTVMTEEDWQAPLQELSRHSQEDWEITDDGQRRRDRTDKPLSEELWDPKRIENTGEDAFA